MSLSTENQTVSGHYASTGAGSAAVRHTMLAYLVVGFSALMIGASIGPLQALNYGGINAYPALRPVLQTYYEGLTIHGVLNGYVFTFFVICGLLVYLPARELGLKPNMPLWLSGFVIMALGTALLLLAMFDNSSSVLWTFYPPLKGSPYFYLGMTLLGAGSLFPLPIVHGLRARWKRSNPGEITPLVTYMSMITMWMWSFAALGVVVELVAFLDPWALGLVGTVDPLITRTLFWLTGHPIVYFWLMPTYISWYCLLPRQAGGKLVSDPMARLTFILLLVFSLPVGSHHQFQDPGFSPVWRGIVTVLTMSVALPSLITAFSLGLSLEYAGRCRGGKGWFGWFKALPWSDPSVAGQVLAALTFILGGATGMVNGSWQLDATVHNTVYVPGHFHVTVGTVTAMTLMSVTFWLLPNLTGRALLSRKLALAAIWLWFAGIMTFALGFLWAGVYGVPRRAWVSDLPHMAYQNLYGSAQVPLTMAAVGGVILWLAIACFYIVFFGTLIAGKRQAALTPVPFAQAIGRRPSYALDLAPSERPAPQARMPDTPALARACEPIGRWSAFAFVVMLAAYLPIFWPLATHVIHAPGWMVW
ncbi:cbb3-type cytochrome c oxidase subunit I [Paraburkholderia oxyphila]|uniref:cbb3-type cytochrome c oxidase subunit I n=1 Tax=Paraburkholderia oxyphila TaxID=614212 RepID=UPI0004864DA3|nr:cbb3-type cytochrome c oxidase subunit I [Paraburkholderia oxyphila]